MSADRQRCDALMSNGQRCPANARSGRRFCGYHAYVFGVDQPLATGSTGGES